MDKMLLQKYADFIVKVGVNVQKGQTLIISCSLEAAELCRLCVKSAFDAGAGDVRVDWNDEAVSRTRMECASEESLSDVKPYVLRSYMDFVESEGGVCTLHIIADDPEIYAGLDSAKINRVAMARRKALKPWIDYKMNDNVQWCIAAMPSTAWAKKLFPDVTVEEAMQKLWKLIFDVCRVTNGNPVEEWRDHVEKLVVLRDKLNAMDLTAIRMTGSNGTDLTIGLAEGAIWDGAASVDAKGTQFLPNLPTEEIFTAPHKDHVDGIVYGTKPYAYNGQLIEDFWVRFENGKVVEHGAKVGEELLTELLNSDDGARGIGEIALVPYSSPVNQSGVLFYDTLFDENAACHMAFGASYPGTTKGGKEMCKEQLLEKGMNQSAIHEDVMIGGIDTNIVGIKRTGEEVAVFVNGEWAL